VRLFVGARKRAAPRHATTIRMSDVIAEYQKWKQEGDNLRAQAKHAMETRFRELLAEAVRIAQEYRADFGVPLKPAPPVTAFRFRPGGGRKAKKAADPKPPVKPKAPEPRAADPKVARLNKRLETARKKLEEAKAAGAPTRTLEDKIYEIEDELRLSGQKG
jgi:hypothetical protein